MGSLLLLQGAELPYFEYRADNAVADYSTTALTGGIVDSSTRGRTNAFASAAGSRPVLNTGGANGHSFLTFDGTDDRLYNNSSTLYQFGNDKAGLTLSAVVKINQPALVSNHQLCFFARAGSTATRMAINIQGGFWSMSGKRLDADATSNLISTTAVDSNLHMLTGVADFSTGEQRLYLDGVLIFSGSPFTVGRSSPTEGFGWSWGSDMTPAGFVPASEFYEVAGWDRALTAEEITARWNVIAARYVPPPATSTSNDNLDITDAATVEWVRSTTANDSLGITDSVVTQWARAATVNDNLGLTDSASASTAAAVTFSPSDILGITDDLTVTWTRADVEGDSLGLTDSATAQRTADRTASDPLGITDAVSTAQARAQTLQDTLDITDAVTVERGWSAPLADSLGITDTLTQVYDRTGAYSDSLSISDAISAVMDRAHTHADSLGISDSVSVVWVRSATINDDLGLTDTASMTRAGAGSASANDPLGLTDEVQTSATRARSAADNLGITDSVTVVWSRSVTIADSLVISDSAAPAYDRIQVLADTLAISDVATFDLVGARDVADALGISDSVEVVWDRFVQVADALTMDDEATPVRVLDPNGPTALQVRISTGAGYVVGYLMVMNDQGELVAPGAMMVAS